MKQVKQDTTKNDCKREQSNTNPPQSDRESAAKEPMGSKFKSHSLTEKADEKLEKQSDLT